VCAALGWCVAGSAAWADLNDPLYKSAMAAYDKNDCVTTIKNLNEYKVKDAAFLDQAANRPRKERIDKVIQYCNRPQTPVAAGSNGPKVKASTVIRGATEADIN